MRTPFVIFCLLVASTLFAQDRKPAKLLEPQQDGEYVNLSLDLEEWITLYTTSGIEVHLNGFASGRRSDGRYNHSFANSDLEVRDGQLYYKRELVIEWSYRSSPKPK